MLINYVVYVCSGSVITDASLQSAQDVARTAKGEVWVGGGEGGRTVVVSTNV